MNSKNKKDIYRKIDAMLSDSEETEQLYHYRTYKDGTLQEKRSSSIPNKDSYDLLKQKSNKNQSKESNKLNLEYVANPPKETNKKRSKKQEDSDDECDIPVKNGKKKKASYSDSSKEKLNEKALVALKKEKCYVNENSYDENKISYGKKIKVEGAQFFNHKYCGYIKLSLCKSINITTERKTETNLERKSKSIAEDLPSYLNEDKLNEQFELFGLKQIDIVKPETAVGTSNFIKLVVKSNVIVDKSMLIKAFLQDLDEVLLYTYARRWGKSTNLSMISTFVRLEVDDEGNICQEKIEQNRKLFIGGEIKVNGKFKNVQSLEIANHPDIILEHQGKYPVIYISFFDLAGKNYKILENKIKKIFMDLFYDHKYLLKRLDKKEKKIYNRYLDNKTIEREDLEHGIFFLCKLLSNRFQRKCFIFVDEYDSAINDSFLSSNEDKEHDTADTDQIQELFRGIYAKAFKDNIYLEKGYITGVLRFAKAGILSGINNVKEYNILDPHYTKYFGFTEDEVKLLLKKYQIDDCFSQDIQNWYNGYNCGNLKIYNPWSIVSCLNEFGQWKLDDKEELKNAVLKSYWVETGSINQIKAILVRPEIINYIEDLIQNKPISFNFSRVISSDDFKVLRKAKSIGSNIELNEPCTDILFSFLFACGYLTISENKKFKIPNQEIKLEFKKFLLSYFTYKYNLKYQIFTNATDKFQNVIDSDSNEKLSETIECFEQSFKELLNALPEFSKFNQQTINDGNKSIHGNEAFIHNLMSHISFQLKYLKKFGSEVKSGNGIADIIFIVESNSRNRGVIIELKFGIVDGADKAIKQIEVKQYDDILKDCNEVIKIGMNVSMSKDVMIEYEFKKN